MAIAVKVTIEEAHLLAITIVDEQLQPEKVVTQLWPLTVINGIITPATKVTYHLNESKGGYKPVITTAKGYNCIMLITTIMILRWAWGLLSTYSSFGSH